MLISAVVLYAFMLGGMKRELVPGRCMMARMMDELHREHASVTSARKVASTCLAYVFAAVHVHSVRRIRSACCRSVFVGRLPVHLHQPLHLATGVLAILSVPDRWLVVGFDKHAPHFFSLFVPHGTPLPMIPLIFVIQLAPVPSRASSAAACVRRLTYGLATCCLRCCRSFVGGADAGAFFMSVRP
jgi:F-type H+-transporting ATPase subunit a